MNSLLSWQPSTNGSGTQTQFTTYHDWWQSKDDPRSDTVNPNETTKSIPRPRSYSSTSVSKSSEPQICSFFLQGMCRFGLACRNLHPKNMISSQEFCPPTTEFYYAQSDSSISDSSSLDADTASRIIESRDSFTSFSSNGSFETKRL